LVRGVFLTFLAGTGLRLLEPWPLKLVLDHLIAVIPQGRGDALPNFDMLESVYVFMVAALGLLGIISLRAFVTHENVVRCAVLAQRVLSTVQAALCHCLARWPLTVQGAARERELLCCVVEDFARLQDALVTTVRPLLANLLLLYGTLAMMGWLCWELTLLLLVAVLLFGLTVVRFAPWLFTIARLRRNREETFVSVTAESLRTRKIIQTLALEAQYASLLSSRGRRSAVSQVKVQRLAASLERRGNILTAVTTALTLPCGAWFVLRGRLTPGEFLVFGVYAWSVCTFMREFAASVRELVNTIAMGERIMRVLECVPLLPDESRAERASTFRGAVRFEHVSFGNAPDQRVLKEIDFSVRPGQHVAIVGPPGSGKSALVDLLLRFSHPSHGRVLIDGRDIRSFTRTSLRSQIGVVSHADILFTASVRDNIACGASRATPGEIMAAARLANVHDFVMTLPRGYDTVVGEGSFPLSLVQCRLLLVARAAVRRASILIFDDPTAGLDEEDNPVVHNALERLALGRTAFFVTRDAHFVAYADLILLLENGRVSECGTPDALLRVEGRYATWSRLQALARAADGDPAAERSPVRRLQEEKTRSDPDGAPPVRDVRRLVEVET
jgi:ATP-binding cassette subfamily B protein